MEPSRAVLENNELIHDPPAKKSEISGMFSGSILPLLARMALPIFGGQLVLLLYNITDTIWISRIDLNDPALVGGTGIIFPILFFAMAIGNGLQVGTSSLVARAIGEENNTLLSKVTESGLLIAIFSSIVVIVFFYLFDEQIVSALGAEGDYFIYALDYFHYITPAAAVLFIGMILLGIVQGEGQMDKVMKAMIIGTAGNIILDPIFIFGFGMGVKGAALATTIAQTMALSYGVSVFLRKKSVVHIEWKISNIRGKVVGQIAGIGFPQALGQATMALSFLFFNRIVVSIDPIALTAFALCGRIEQIVLLPVFAMGAALLTMVGQNAGRGLHNRVRTIWRTTVFSAFIVVGSLSTLMFLFAPSIYPFFSEIPEVIEYAVLQTRIMIYPFMITAVGILAGFLFQGVGKPIPALIVTVLRILGLALPAMYLGVYVLGGEMFGVWGGIIFGNTVGTIIAYIWSQAMLKKLEKGEINVKTAELA